jgi:outer membrane receptor protein involved in Fe transport
MGKRISVALFTFTCLSVVVIADGARLLGQSPSAEVVGAVRDSVGHPILGAEVVARNDATGLTYVTQSGQGGEYWLGGLPPGQYDLTVRKIGHVPIVRRALALPVGARRELNVILPRAAVELDPIEVFAGPPLLEPTESDVSFVLDRERIRRLPEESREFVDLALVAPGATAAPENPEPVAGTQIGALNSYSLSVLVDGGQLVGGGGHEFSGRFPLLAIQEFEVLTSSYSAEFGQAASGVINAVTRRGTNHVSAEGFVLYRHRALNALGPFETRKPDFNRRHWGIAIGGPVQQDRTHFFVALERKVENSFATVETDGAFPDLEGTFGTPFEDNLLFARIDHRMSPAHEVTLRYGGELSNQRTEIGASTSCTFLGGSNLASAEFGANVDRVMHSVLGRHRWTVGARVLNEATIHYVRSREERSRLTEGPAFKFPTLCTGGNHFAWDTPDYRLELKEELSLATGSHQIKLGAHLSVIGTNTEAFNFGNGAFVFPTDTSSAPLVFTAILGPVAFGADEQNSQVGVYVQDHWRPLPNLSLNLGLRYDIETNGTNQGFVDAEASQLPFIAATARPIDKSNVAPRIGWAWDALGDGTTIIRGGFGLFYDQLAVWYAGLESHSPPLAIVFNPGTTNPNDIRVDPDTIPPLRQVMDTVMSTPVTRQFSLGVERLLPGDITLRMDGIVVQGRNLVVGHQRNPLDPATGLRKFPDFGPVVQLRSIGEAEGKLLIVRARKAFDWGGIDLHYTLADRKATVDRWFDFVSAVPDTANDFSSEFGPADWHERHRVVVMADAHLPLGFDAALKSIYSSARPFTAIDSVDHNGDGNFNDRPPGEGRNDRRGPDFFRIDVGLARRVRVGGIEMAVQFNVYNLLNRTNLNPSSVVPSRASPLFGRASSALPGRQAEIGTRVRF